MISRASSEIVLWVLLFLRTSITHFCPLVSDLITMNFHNDVTIRLADAFSPFRFCLGLWT